jgi:MFS family permease
MTAPDRARRTPYYGLLGAYTVSILGTSMSALAIPWFVLVSTGSAGKTGLVAFAEMLPYVMLQALAGPLVDRVGPRRAYVWGNALAALVIGVIPAAYALGDLALPVLIALVAVGGAVRGAADTANSALVPATATAGRIPLERAASLSSGANRTALLLGAPLAGVLVTLVGSPIVILIDAVTFGLAAATVAVFVRGLGTPAAVDDAAADDPGPAVAPAPRSGAIRRYSRDLVEGLRFVGGDRLLLGMMTMIAVSNLIDQGMSAVLMPVWVRTELHSAAALGVIDGVFGLGSLLGNLLAAWLASRMPRRMTYGIGFLIGGAPRFAIIAVAASISPVIAVFLLCGITGGGLNGVIGATLYERIPESLRARVLGVVRASAWVGIPFGALLTGVAVDGFGLRATIVVAGVAYLVTSLAPFVFPAWREMKRPEPAPESADPAEERAYSIALAA